MVIPGGLSDTKNKDDTMTTAIDNVREMLTEKPKDDNSK